VAVQNTRLGSTGSAMPSLAPAKANHFGSGCVGGFDFVRKTIVWVGLLICGQ
jgi:hypothetical protein